MEYHCVKLRLRSALGTPLAADTLFGHVCWGIRHYEGESRLVSFLEDMSGEKPPMLLSDPFPSGFLPMPVLPPLQPEERLQLIQRLCGTQWVDLAYMPEAPPASDMARCLTPAEAHDVLKTLSRPRWLPEAVLYQHRENLSLNALIRAQLDSPMASPPKLTEGVSPHNKIDRLCGGTIKGGLFFSDDLFPEAPYDFDLYFALHAPEKRDVESFLLRVRNGLAGGYGRDKSIGRGTIDVVEESLRPVEFPGWDGANAAMLLGPCAPKSDDPTEGFWRLFSKAGKLGGDWAVGPGPDREGTHNPHKRTLTVLTRGSVLLVRGPRPVCGRMVGNIHPVFTEVKQYGLSLTFPLRIQGLESIV